MNQIITVFAAVTCPFMCAGVKEVQYSFYVMATDNDCLAVVYTCRYLSAWNQHISKFIQNNIFVAMHISNQYYIKHLKN